MVLAFLVSSFITLFLIVDAFGNVPLFESLFRGIKESERQRLIKKSVIIACITLIVFTFGGTAIFKLFGIQLYSFRIAGGIILLIIALQMLLGRRERITKSEREEAEEKENIAVVPMAVPLQTGGGAITAGIVLAGSAATIPLKIGLLLSILLVFAVSYFIYKNMKYFFIALGKTGTGVITRIMGLILATIAVEFVITGISEAVKVIL